MHYYERALKGEAATTAASRQLSGVELSGLPARLGRSLLTRLHLRFLPNGGASQAPIVLSLELPELLPGGTGQHGAGTPRASAVLASASLLPAALGLPTRLSGSAPHRPASDSAASRAERAGSSTKSTDSSGSSPPDGEASPTRHAPKVAFECSVPIEGDVKVDLCDAHGDPLARVWINVILEPAVSEASRGGATPWQRRRLRLLTPLSHPSTPPNSPPDSPPCARRWQPSCCRTRRPSRRWTCSTRRCFPRA